MNGELRTFRRRRLTPEEGKRAADRALKMPIDERREDLQDLHLDDPETLLPLLDALRREWDTAPERVLSDAAYLYEFLEKLEPKYGVDAFLLDEREYFLGESALIAGTVCRNQSRRDDARQWFELADAWFLLTENSAGNLAKVAYQRLALKVEERDFPSILKVLPQLIQTFNKLGMRDDALKARFLGANVLRETDRLPDAAEAFEEIGLEAESIHNDRLLSYAYVNLIQVRALLGNPDEAFEAAKKAMPILQKMGNRIGLAKLHWGIGYLFRTQNNVPAAMESFRAGQREFAELEMRADVAAVHLVVADMLLDADQEKQAEWEIRQALPLIEEYKLVPEGFAAMTLLRESLRRQKIDRQALRNLHGYFEELHG